MKARIEFLKQIPELYQALVASHEIVDRSGLEPGLLDLVYMRASQINGCAWCLDMHSKDARARGEGEQRLYTLSAWRETPFFSDRERAALAWTEAVTRVSESHVPDEVFEEARACFSEKELVALTLAIAGINSWNRFNVAFRNVPGAYVSHVKPEPRRETVKA